MKENESVKDYYLIKFIAIVNKNRQYEDGISNIRVIEKVVRKDWLTASQPAAKTRRTPSDVQADNSFCVPA